MSRPRCGELSAVVNRFDRSGTVEDAESLVGDGADPRKFVEILLQNGKNALNKRRVQQSLGDRALAVYCVAYLRFETRPNSLLASLGVLTRSV